MDDREHYAKGMEVRRAVLGDEYVNRAIEKKNRSPLNFRR